MVPVTRQEAEIRLRKLLSSEGKSENTSRAYIADLNAFFDHIYVNSVRTSTLNTDVLDSAALLWIVDQRSKIAPATTNRRIASMRALGRCYDVSVLVAYKGPKVGRRPAHPLPSGMDDVRKVLAVCKTDDQRALVVLTGFCGLRVSEARSIKPWSLVDDGNDNWTLYVRGKGDKERIIPVAPLAMTLLKAIIAKYQWGGERSDFLVDLSDRGARVALTRLGKEAGIARGIASHDFRMTFGSTIYKSSQDLRTTQELLGHASPNTTMGYTLIEDDTKRAAVCGAIV